MNYPSITIVNGQVKKWTSLGHYACHEHVLCRYGYFECVTYCKQLLQKKKGRKTLLICGESGEVIGEL